MRYKHQLHMRQPSSSGYWARFRILLSRDFVVPVRGRHNMIEKMTIPPQLPSPGDSFKTLNRNTLLTLDWEITRYHSGFTPNFDLHQEVVFKIDVFQTDGTRRYIALQ